MRTDQITLARTNIPLEGRKTKWESRKLHSKRFSYFFSLGAPDILCAVRRRNEGVHVRKIKVNHEQLVQVKFKTISLFSCNTVYEVGL